MTFSDRIREELKAEVGPCRECGHARMTTAALSEELKIPASTVGRYLAGGKPPVALLDAAEEWLAARAEAIVGPILKNLVPNALEWEAALERTPPVEEILPA